MKKIIRIFLIIVATLIVALFALPIVFKSTLLEKTKTTLNKHIKSEVNFSDFSISLLRNFPNATLSLKDVTLIGTGEFKQDTLLKIPQFSTRIAMFSLFKQEGIKIEEIVFDKPSVYLKVAANGNVNWDIIKEDDAPSASAPKGEVSEKNSFALKLQKIKISDADIVYNDISMPMLLTFFQSDFNLRGKMYATTTELEGNASVGSFSLAYDSVTYISKTVLKTNSLITIDYNTMDIGIKNSELWINSLPLDIAGDVKMPKDTILFNLDFQSRKSGFGDFLDLVPPDFEVYLKGLETEGTASLSGAIKGYYAEEDYPAFNLGLDIIGGRINYTELPEEIKNIQADIKIDKPQGDFDLTRVNIHNAHAEIKDNPIDLQLYLSNLISNPTFDGRVAGKINLSHLKEVLPLDSIDIAGIIQANLKVKGDYSQIEKKEYDKIQSTGTVLLAKFEYNSPAFSKSIMIPNGKLDFSPLSIQFPQLDIKIGESDMQLEGSISNYLNYFFQKGTLDGDLKLKSSKLNINELMVLQVEGQKDLANVSKKEKIANQQASNKEVPLIKIPSNINLAISANVLKTIYDEIPISNIQGEIALKNGKINLYGLEMALLDGNLKLNGYYENSPLSKSGFEIVGTASHLDIPTAYKSLAILRDRFPELGQSKGKIGGNIKISGEFNPDLKVRSSSGNIKLNTFSYAGPQFTSIITIPEGKLEFTLDEIKLAQLTVLIGSSDLNLSGKILNYLNYYTNKGDLSGEVSLTSEYINLNELMALQVKETKENTTKEKRPPAKTSEPKEAVAFNVPPNVAININTEIKKALYGKMSLTNINGLATIANGKLELQGLRMKMLDGEMKMTGSYENNAENKPLFDIGFELLNFNIPAAFKEFSGVQKMLPIAGQSQGLLTSSFKMKGQLQPDMKINYPSLNGQGHFNTVNLQIVKSPVFSQISGILKEEKLNKLKIADLMANFRVENGNLLLKPFKTKIAGQETTISGGLNTQNILDMKLDFIIQREAFGKDIQSILSVIPGQEQIKTIPAMVEITGAVGKPEIKIDLSKTKESIMDELKNKTKEDLQKSLDKLGGGVKKLLNKKK